MSDYHGMRLINKRIFDFAKIVVVCDSLSGYEINHPAILIRFIVPVCSLLQQAALLYTVIVKSQVNLKVKCHVN